MVCIFNATFSNHFCKKIKMFKMWSGSNALTFWGSDIVPVRSGGNVPWCTMLVMTHSKALNVPLVELSVIKSNIWKTCVGALLNQQCV